MKLAGIILSAWISIPMKKISAASTAKKIQPAALVFLRLIATVKTINRARPAPKGKPFKLVWCITVPKTATNAASAVARAATPSFNLFTPKE